MIPAIMIPAALGKRSDVQVLFVRWGWPRTAGIRNQRCYERPLTRLRSLLCLAQRSFPLLSGVVLSPLLCKDGVSNFKGAMSCATIADGIAGAI
jgi:hypothetical protein